MRVLVAGATGAIGRPLVRTLLERGHDVVGVARSDDNERLLRKLGATPRRADLFDARALARAAEGAEVVIRAATHIPTRGRGTRAEWATNDRIRRDGTRALLAAAREAGARRFVQESIVWVARPPYGGGGGGAPFDETSPVHPDEKVASAIDAERIAAEADGDLATLTLRLGWLYGPDTEHTRQFARMLRGRRLPVIAGGAAPLSFLHVEDAARAFADAAESDARGILHVVDERPTPVAAFFDDLAKRVGAPRPMRVPRWAGVLGAGPFITRLLTTPMVTDAKRMREATVWKPKFATVEQGLDHVQRTWRDEGFTP